MADEARFVLAKKIARGGMAEIFLGKQISSDGFERLCAIKRILPHYAQDKEFIDMFRDEAHICKRLQHANIVRVEGFEEVEGSYAIIMEFVDGADLRTVLSASEKGPLRITPAMAVFIIAEAARGLHYAHTKIDEITQKPLEIVHRDISPQNLLISFEGEVKVTDFGIAEADNKMTETKPGIVKGKYSYMSPEQISAKPVDARTDIFALSIVLWEMLAMKRLFQGENEVDTIQKVKNCKIEFDIRQLNPDVDEDLNNILMKGLAKDVKKRYLNAAEFERDLRKYLGKRYPEFTAADLGTFLKKVLANKKKESEADIKKTLTSTNLKPLGSKTGLKAEKQESTGHQPLVLDSGPIKPTGLNIATGNSPISSHSNLNQAQQSALNKPAIVGHSTSSKKQHGGNTNLKGTLSRQQPHIYPKSNSSFSKSLIYIFLGTAGIMLIMGLFAVKNGHLSAKDPAMLELTTSPSVTKLIFDGKRITKDGRYQKTPVKIKITPGKHVLKASRPGYAMRTWEFEASPGEQMVKDDLSLKPVVRFAPTRIVVSGAKNRAFIDIANGFTSGFTPLNADDLAYGVTQNIRIFPNYPSQSQAFACTFTPKAQNAAKPFVVNINIKDRKCSFQESN